MDATVRDVIMAKRDFLNNIRVARNLFAHPSVLTDSPELDPEARERALAMAAIWLTPSSVRGFDANDFAELGEETKCNLAGAVRAFEEVAHKVEPTEVPTAEQRENASKAFQIILDILAPYMPARRDEVKIREALERVTFPPEWVANWDFHLGEDAYGEPAVWLTIYANENRLPQGKYGRLALDVTKKARQALSDSGIHQWPYVNLRTALEYKSR